MSRWPVDWAIALVAAVLIEKGVSAGYGYKHASRSILYPDSPWGDLELATGRARSLQELAADALMGEQLMAAGVHAGDDGDRQPGIDRDGVVERQLRLEI